MTNSLWCRIFGHKKDIDKTDLFADYIVALAYQASKGRITMKYAKDEIKRYGAKL